jgi:hypothetical protein
MTINPFLDRDDLLTKIRVGFIVRDSHYPDRRAALKAQLKPLADRLDQLQKQGHPMVCAEQILLEAQWLSNYGDDWDHAAQRIADLTQGRFRPAARHFRGSRYSEGPLAHGGVHVDTGRCLNWSMIFRQPHLPIMRSLRSV